MYAIAVLYEVNTQHIQFQSLATRLNNLTAAVEAAANYVNREIPPGTSPLRAILAAPEYLFARSIAAVVQTPAYQFHKIAFGSERPGEQVWGERRQLGPDEIQKVRRVCATLSAQFPEALLIPGSVAWRKRIASQQAFVKYYWRLRDTQTINMITGPNEQFNAQKTVFPTQFESNPNRLVPTIQDKLDALRTATYVAKNTAHCYFNGQCIFKYNKIGDFHEVQDGLDTVHLPAGQAGRFQLPGLDWVDFGIAICYDQSLSMQIDGPQGEPWKYSLQYTEGAVNFHILLSAQISPQVGNAYLKQGGYLLSASSAKEYNAVVARSGAHLTPVHTLSSNGDTLEFFLVKVPSGPNMFALRVMGASEDDSVMLDYQYRLRSAPGQVVSARLPSVGVVNFPNLRPADVEIRFPGYGDTWTNPKAGENYMLTGARYSFVCE